MEESTLRNRKSSSLQGDEPEDAEEGKAKALFSVYVNATFTANNVFEFDRSAPPTILDVALQYLSELFPAKSKRIAVATQKFYSGFDLFSLTEFSRPLEDRGRYELKYRVCNSLEASQWERVVQEGNFKKMREENAAAGLTLGNLDLWLLRLGAAGGCTFLVLVTLVLVQNVARMIK